MKKMMLSLGFVLWVLLASEVRGQVFTNFYVCEEAHQAQVIALRENRFFADKAITYFPSLHFPKNIAVGGAYALRGSWSKRSVVPHLRVRGLRLNGITDIFFYENYLSVHKKTHTAAQEFTRALKAVSEEGKALYMILDPILISFIREGYQGEIDIYPTLRVQLLDLLTGKSTAPFKKTFTATPYSHLEEVFEKDYELTIDLKIENKELKGSFTIYENLRETVYTLVPFQGTLPLD